jgi:mono/diheme cytochrome c family protein
VCRGHYLVALAAAFIAAPLLAQPPASIQDLAHPQGTNAGIFAFTGRCATCHDTGRGGATDRYALNRHTPEEVLGSITTGSMAQYAQGLTEYEKRVVAVYVGGRPLGSAAEGDAARMKNRCESVSTFAPAPASEWNGWGFDRGNSRFQTSAGLTAADTPRLTLKWAFGFPTATPPTVSRQSLAAACSSAPTPASCIRSTRRAGAFTGRSGPTPACARPSALAAETRRTASWLTSGM